MRTRSSINLFDHLSPCGSVSGPKCHLPHEECPGTGHCQISQVQRQQKCLVQMGFRITGCQRVMGEIYPPACHFRVLGVRGAPEHKARVTECSLQLSFPTQLCAVALLNRRQPWERLVAQQNQTQSHRQSNRMVSGL